MRRPPLQESWFNRGAASERWLPPEQQARHPAPPAAAPLQTPYFCDAAGPAEVEPRAEAPQRQRPSLAERYQRGESVASLLQQQPPPVAAPAGAAPPQPLQRDFPWTWKA